VTEHPPGDASAGRPHADVSVRVAWADDAAAVARLQVRSWQEGYAGLIPADTLAELPVDVFEARWHQAIARPREARERVLVALERASVRGFAATAPATDADAKPSDDAEITELVVDPDHRHAGHGSRLLHAAIDTMRSDKFQRATIWVVADDDLRRGFLTAQGWAADGAHRELDLHGDGTVLVKSVRLHTDLTP
jgi:ribosomal protein S18 acetylase RimI-like enzyme